jgi:hypothetical protein
MGLRVAWSRCADEAAAPTLWPWTQVLRTLGVEAPRVPTAAAEPAGVPPPDVDAGRSALFERVTEALAAAAARTPLLVVLDDLHGADPTSLHLLRFLVGRIARLPLLVVATLRDSADERTDALVHTLADLARERAVVRLSLRGLETDEVAELLVDRGLTDQGLAEELRRRTEGNPFFLVELVALLRSEGRRTPADVPASVRDVLDRRLARLPPDTRALLTLAAVIGREFPLDVLEAAAELDAERIGTLIEAAVITGLVVEEGEGWVWRFSHELVRETIVAGLTRLQRARLHRQIAGGIESLPVRARRERLDALAHHSYLAGPFAEEGAALRYALAAAAAARERFAFGTAAGHMQRAVELSASDDADQALRRERQGMLVALGRDRRAAGDLAGAQAALLEGIELARGLGDDDLAVTAAGVFGGVSLWNWRAYGSRDEQVIGLLDELLAGTGPDAPRRRAELLGTLACELCYTERRAEGMAAAREAARIARELDDVPLLGRVLNNLYVGLGARWGGGAAGRPRRGPRAGGPGFAGAHRGGGAAASGSPGAAVRRAPRRRARPGACAPAGRRGRVGGAAGPGQLPGGRARHPARGVGAGGEARRRGLDPAAADGAVGCAVVPGGAVDDRALGAGSAGRGARRAGGCHQRCVRRVAPRGGARARRGRRRGRSAPAGGRLAGGPAGRLEHRLPAQRVGRGGGGARHPRPGDDISRPAAAGP